MEVSSPTLCPHARPSGDQELLDELCGSGEDSQVAKAAFHSQWQQEGRGCVLRCVGKDAGAIQRDANAEDAAEQGLRWGCGGEGGTQCPGRALLRCPGPGRARQGLGCPFCISSGQQPLPAAEVRSRP